MPKKKSKIPVSVIKGKAAIQTMQHHKYTLKSPVGITRKLLPHKKG